MAGSIHLSKRPQEPLLVEPSNYSDAERLARRGLRVADMVELRAMRGADSQGSDIDLAIDALREGFYPGSWTVWFRGEPCAMFGCPPFPGDHGARIGAIWLLGHDDLICQDARASFVRQSRGWFDIASEGYDLVTNYVHENNHVHIRWLRWLDCQFLQRVEVHGHGFLEFVHV